jgi:hypothetical protein
MADLTSPGSPPAFDESGSAALPRSATYACLANLVAPAGWGAKPALPPEISWPHLLEASSEHVVTPALAWRLAGDDRVPPAYRKHLQAVLALGRERNRQLRHHLAAIGCVLNDAGVVPLLLKGASYLARDLYPDDGIRYLGDLDVLVPDEGLGEARAALERHGFGTVGAAALPPDHHHLPAMQHSGWSVIVELHRRPVANRLCAIVDAGDVMRAGTPFRLGEAQVLLPSPTHSVLMGIVHGQLQDHGHRMHRPWLRPLLDFARQAEVFGPSIDWREIEDRFGPAQRHVLAEFLVLSEHLMKVPLPIGVDDEARLAPAEMVSALDRPTARRVLATTGDLLARAFRMLTRLRDLRPRSFSRGNWRRRFEPFSRRW